MPGSFRNATAVIHGIFAILVVTGTVGSLSAQEFPVDNLDYRGGAGCCGGSEPYVVPIQAHWWHRPWLPPRPWMPWKRHHHHGHYSHGYADPYAMMAPEFAGFPNAGGETCCQGSAEQGGYNGDGLYVPGGAEVGPYPMQQGGIPAMPEEPGRIHAKPMDPASPTPLQPQPGESNWQPMPPRSMPEKIEIPNIEPVPMSDPAPKAKEAPPPPKDAKIPVLRSTSGMFRPVPGAARAWQAVSQTTLR